MYLYRPPNSSNLDQFFENLEILLEILSKNFKNIVIIGDYNIDVLTKMVHITNL